VRGPLRPVVDCHCAQCRRTSGHFAAFTAARPQDLGLNELLRAMLDRLLVEPGGASLPV
jgi:hypothetical protein